MTMTMTPVPPVPPVSTQPATPASTRLFGGTGGDWRHRLLRYHLPLALSSAVAIFLWTSLSPFRQPASTAAAQHGAPPAATQAAPAAPPAQAAGHLPPRAAGHLPPQAASGASSPPEQ